MDRIPDEQEYTLKELCTEWVYKYQLSVRTKSSVLGALVRRGLAWSRINDISDEREWVISPKGEEYLKEHFIMEVW